MLEKNDSRMDRRDYFKSSLQSNRVSFRKRYKKMNRKSLFEFFVNQHLYFFLLLSVMQSPLFYLVVVFPARISFIFKLFTSSLLPIADMSKCHSPIDNSLLVVTEELQNKYFMNLLVFFCSFIYRLTGSVDMEAVVWSKCRLVFACVADH